MGAEWLTPMVNPIVNPILNNKPAARAARSATGFFTADDSRWILFCVRRAQYRASPDALAYRSACGGALDNCWYLCADMSGAWRRNATTSQMSLSSSVLLHVGIALILMPCLTIQKASF